MLKAFPVATLVRPAVMFGPGDAFAVALLTMLRKMPAFPMFGAGATRLQPVYVEDVAEAITRLSALDKGDAAAYLNWIRSDDGQKVVKEVGYFPLPENLRQK